MRTGIFRENDGAFNPLQLSSFVQSVAECFEMNRERGGIEGIERPHILEQLVELGLNLQFEALILIECVSQPIERENKAFCSLSEDRNRGSLGGKFVVGGSEGDQKISRAAFAPV